jgi:N-acetylneuraminic acid mutarotase
VGGYGPDWSPVATVFEYDPAQDTWRARAPMPTPRGALAVGVIGEKVYAVGGVGAGRRNTGATEAYDPQSDRWRTRAPIRRHGITWRWAWWATACTPSGGGSTEAMPETCRSPRNTIPPMIAGGTAARCRRPGVALLPPSSMATFLSLGESR